MVEIRRRSPRLTVTSRRERRSFFTANYNATGMAGPPAEPLLLPRKALY